MVAATQELFWKKEIKKKTKKKECSQNPGKIFEDASERAHFSVKSKTSPRPRVIFTCFRNTRSSIFQKTT